jgi:rRNA maturation RNase YbeY
MTSKQPLIQFNYLIKPFYFSERTVLKNFLLHQITNEGYNVDTINFIFCNDDYIIEINKQYLQHDTYTDIITFQLSEKGQPIISDIYISVERVRENALVYNTRFSIELHRVIFHGCLHLCGFKDKKKSDASLMREKENEYLYKYFVSRGTRKAHL